MADRVIEAPVRYKKNPQLQSQFAGSFLNPPVKECDGILVRRTESGWYEAFWKGYDGVALTAAMGAAGTLRRAVFMAGRERRRLERKGLVPSLADVHGKRFKD